MPKKKAESPIKPESKEKMEVVEKLSEENELLLRKEIKQKTRGTWRERRRAAQQSQRDA